MIGEGAREGDGEAHGLMGNPDEWGRPGDDLGTIWGRSGDGLGSWGIGVE